VIWIKSWRGVLGAALLSLLVGFNLLVPAAPVASAAPVPTGLPTHFGLGLAAHPDATGIYGWMPDSAIPWDYAYQYLSGGVNTGGGWETWNSGGQFPLYYAQGAASHNYLPVFSYYELLQSSGSCGSCGESQKDLANLNNASLMSSYYQNFALLMQRLGSGTYSGIAGFGKTAIVHVEPDLSAYAEQAVLNIGSGCSGYCTATGNNPAFLQAAVASSGDADVAAYPNTYQGFNWALLHLRDLYAPNVLLAFHVSDWATGTDIGSSSSTSLDAAALGQQAGSFAAQAGITGVPAGTSSYNLLFNDVSDRDAGYYKNVYGDAAAWWDRLNLSFPNFHRWESYIGAVSSAANRSVIVWQVPLGNQYYASENNTDGHYQDNRVEYFMAHLGELQQSGVIGLLFGAGNGGSTVQYDGMADGITNPASFCTTDGMSTGSTCNNHTSAYADDDGGYLRTQAQAYYAGLGNTSTSSTTSTTTNTTGSTTASSTVSSTSSTASTSTMTSSSSISSTSSTSSTPSTSSTTSTTTPAPTLTFSSTGASPTAVSARQYETLTGSITSNRALTGVTVTYRVVTAAGQQVYSRSWTGQSFRANTARTYSASWRVPRSTAAGAYTLQIVVTSTGGAVLANDLSAGQFTVQ
jgi:hypothetical protein